MINDNPNQPARRKRQLAELGADEMDRRANQAKVRAVLGHAYRASKGKKVSLAPVKFREAEK